MRARGAQTVDVVEDAEEEYAQHCADMDLLSAPLRDCVSYYNNDGKAKPGSLAYYGGGQRWHDRRMAAQESMAPYLFDGRYNIEMRPGEADPVASAIE